MKHPNLPWNDAAPLAGGACVSTMNSRPKSTASIRLIPPARRNAPPGTSDEAARMIAGHAARQRAEVLAVIVRAGPFGATDAEIETASGIRAQSVSPRRGELVRLGNIADSGRRRPTPRGRPAAVWIASEHADRPEGPEGGRA